MAVLKSVIYAENLREKNFFSYFSKNPSNTMVRKILNLLSTVNMGKLRQKNTSC